MYKYIFFIIFCYFSVANLSADNSKANTEFVPQWAKSAIWYQIFPERFRNGDQSNNPTLNDILGADPVEAAKHWQLHPWGSDWYERLDYEVKNGEAELWKHLLRRRYGGDLQGVIDKLDYLQDLGINAIYLNPVFDSPSLHKYDAASYHHIDPNFGPDPDGDRKLMATENPLDPKTWVWTKADELALELIEKAHQRNIKIIFDGVFNHMGINSFAFKDLQKNQEKSAYKDWFIIDSFDDPEKGTKLSYKGWFGVESLPEWKEDENGLVSGPRDYVFAITERWMNPKNKGIKFGIDGWRLDVAFNVHHNFWKIWRKHVKQINPEAYLTAEIVDTPENVQPYFQGDEFDGEMNYNFAFTLSEFMFNPKESSITPSELDTKLHQLRNLYPEGVAYVVQNLFGSHDSNRIGSHIVNANNGIGNFRDWGHYFGSSQAANNSNYDVRKPNKKELHLQKLFTIFQMTYVGAPMIYYGDEVGLWGGNDPDCRKPMLWSDINYDDEIYLANGQKREQSLADKVEINNSLFNHYKKLINIRNNHQALQLGDFKTIITDDTNSIYGFSRSYKGETINVVFNNSNEAKNIIIPVDKNTTYKDLLNETKIKSVAKNLALSLPAKWGAIITKVN
ncbi:MAG: alpha-amylase [Gammaproteobacteria bacterium]|nr:MAG: alpha-amylase [Gammaproteobacteria bacterium]